MLIERDFKAPNLDYKKRLYYKKYEINKNVLKSLISYHKHSIFWKIYFQKIIQTYPINSSISRYKNYCMGHSVKGRVVFRLFKLCRHQTKNMGSNGYLYGFRKSSF
jgi:ribosomal protein S14